MLMRRSRFLTLMIFLLTLWLWSSAQAADDLLTENGFVCRVQPDKTLTILQYTGSGGLVKVPDTLGGYPVTGIAGYAFEGCGTVTRISLPLTIRQIGANPFAYCYSLQDIVLSSTHSYLAMEDGALYSVQDSRLICCLSTRSSDTFTVRKGTLIIGEAAFAGNRSIRHVTLPRGLTQIDDRAFLESNLESITLNASLQSIGAKAFSLCLKLEKITLPRSLTSLGEGVFSNSGLKIITFSYGIR